MWKNKNPSNDNDDCYYSVMELKGDGMQALRQLFFNGEANELNFCIFSTSGIHGSYATIEDVETDLQRIERHGAHTVTFCVIQPRIVCVRYGVAEPRTADDISFLKKLRFSSLHAVSKIGWPTETPFKKNSTH